MLPDFNKYGHLPEGVWSCDLAELERRFAVFAVTDRRILLFNKLTELLDEVLPTKVIADVIIDGSFATSKSEPNDIDILFGTIPDYDLVDAPFWIQNKLDTSRLRKKYRFDIFIEESESFDYLKKVDFFQKVRDSFERKGVVRLLP